MMNHRFSVETRKALGVEHVLRNAEFALPGTIIPSVLLHANTANSGGRSTEKAFIRSNCFRERSAIVTFDSVD